MVAGGVSEEEEQNSTGGNHHSNNAALYQITSNSANNDFTPYKLSASTAQTTNGSNNFKNGFIDIRQNAHSKKHNKNNLVSSSIGDQQTHFYSYEKRS
jgi:hypothetical protein